MILQAERERDITVEHLTDIDRLVNESLQMLSRFQDLNTKILPLMEDYLIALRSRDNTPASLLRMDKEHEEEMINNYTSDVKAKIQGKLFIFNDDILAVLQIMIHFFANPLIFFDSEREKEREEDSKKQMEAKTTESKELKISTTPVPPVEAAKELKIEVHATAVHHEKLDPIVAHAQSHEISHNQAVSQKFKNPNSMARFT